MNLSTASVTPTTSVQRQAAEALTKMRGCRDEAAIQIGDAYQGIQSQAPDRESRVVSRTVARVSQTLRTAPSLAESARVVDEVGLKALAAGVSAPIGKTLAAIGLDTRSVIDTQTFWGRSGTDEAGQGRVVGWYLRAIGEESSDAGEKSLVDTAFAAEQGKARCFDRVAFDSEALRLVRDGRADAAGPSSLLKDADRRFYQWPDQPSFG